MLNQVEILSLLPIAVVLLDDLGRCVYANPRWQELSGLSRDASADEGWMRAFQAADLQRLWQAVGRHANPAEDAAFECRLTLAGGAPRPVRLHAKLIPGSAKQAGGYLLTVEDLAAQGLLPPPFHNRRDGSALKSLTPRQREALRLIASGHTTKEIAHLLNISVKTVETHRKDLMERLGIQSLPRLILFAVRTGLVVPEQ